MSLAYDHRQDVYRHPDGREASRAEVREHHRTTPSESGYGWTEDGMAPYFPGIPCCECGRFVGRDGRIEVEHFEMSSTIASVDGTCARCLAVPGDQHQPDQAADSEA